MNVNEEGESEDHLIKIYVMSPPPPKKKRATKYLVVFIFMRHARAKWVHSFTASTNYFSHSKLYIIFCYDKVVQN